jgi:phosphonopyruvate decarboxylase
MIDSRDLLARLLQEKVGLFTGVPCSLLKPLINCVLSKADLAYIGAASEGEAVGMSVGSYLAGRVAVVMLQNSGLGNIVDPMTSLTNVYKIPCLLIISHRGEPGIGDAAHHQIMGRITEELLDTLGIYWQSFPIDAMEIEAKVASAFEHMSVTSLPSAFVLKKGMVRKFNPESPVAKPEVEKGQVLENGEKEDIKATRKQAVIKVAGNLRQGELVISTAGKISRELSCFADRPSNFYMQGSMGCAASIGLGVALGQDKRTTVVLDGDGAVLMKMGTLATIGHYRPKRFLHIILDNESHDSTGGQPTVSSTISFPQIAVSCGYCRAVTVYSLDKLNQYLNSFLSEEGPSLLHMKVRKGADKDLARPTLSPEEIRDRFRNSMGAE